MGLFFIEFRSCDEGHMGGATKIVEPICGASKGVFKGVARFKKIQKREKLLNMIDINEKCIESNFCKTIHF
jgi:hypothetical protein